MYVCFDRYFSSENNVCNENCEWTTLLLSKVQTAAAIFTCKIVYSSDIYSSKCGVRKDGAVSQYFVIRLACMLVWYLV